jgi:hypothetical protein
MKINGSLVFDESSASEVRNLRLEKFPSAVPTHLGAPDTGRLIYVVSSGIIYVGTDTTFIPLATGGDATALLAEVDAIEASLGSLVSSNGTFVPGALTGTLGSATSITNLFEKLQALAASASAATAAEVTRATAAESTLTASIASEVTRATAAESTLTASIASEVTRATNAEGVLTSSISSEVTRATAAEGVLTSATAAETTRAMNAEALISTDLTSEVTRATGAEAVLTSAIQAEATTARSAETAIATNLASEITRATAADAVHTADIATEVARATAAEGVIASDLASEISRATAAEAAITSAFDARVQGLTWKNAVRVGTTGNIDLSSAASGYDGITLVSGDRVLVHFQTAPEENGIYVFNGVGSALTRSTDMDVASEFSAATVYVQEGSTQADLGFTQTAEVTTVGTSAVNFVQFNGAGSVVAGAGLTQTGNTIDVVAGDSSITVTADAIMVSSALQNSISSNTSAIATETAARIAGDTTNADAIVAESVARDAAIAVEVAARIADVDLEEARAIAAEAVLTSSIASEVTRATAAEGVIASNLASEIARATAAEAAANAATAAEATRATAAEGVLTTSIASEVTRATAAEAALSTRVTSNETKLSKIYYLYDGASNTTHTVTHNLGQKYCNVTVVDSTDEVVIPQSIHFTDANSLVVTFNTSIAAKVVVMGLA